jgi:hypothetical protein
MDLLYEESKRGELITTDVESRLRNLEKRLEDKNKEISKLYTENIRLENIVRRYEHEFSVLSNMPIIPISCSSSDPETKKVETDTVPEANKVETDTVPETKKVETHPVVEQKEQKEQKEQQQKPKSKGKDRREYMAEYQRNYRKAKREREKNTVINV